MIRAFDIKKIIFLLFLTLSVFLLSIAISSILGSIKEVDAAACRAYVNFNNEGWVGYKNGQYTFQVFDLSDDFKIDFKWKAHGHNPQASVNIDPSRTFNWTDPELGRIWFSHGASHTNNLLQTNTERENISFGECCSDLYTTNSDTYYRAGGIVSGLDGRNRSAMTLHSAAGRNTLFSSRDRCRIDVIVEQISSSVSVWPTISGPSNVQINDTHYSYSGSVSWFNTPAEFRFLVTDKIYVDNIYYNSGWKSVPGSRTGGFNPSTGVSDNVNFNVSSGGRYYVVLQARKEGSSTVESMWYRSVDVNDRGEGTSMNVSVSGPSSVTLTPDFPVVAPRYEGVFDWTGPSAEYRFRTINSNGNTVQNTGWQNMPSSNRVSYYSAFNTPGNYQVCASGRVDAGDNRYPRQGQDTSCTNVTVTFVGDPDEETTLRINSSNPSSGVGMDFAGNSTHYAGQRVETSRTFERDGNIDVRVFAAPTAPNGNEFRYWTGCNNLGSDPRDCRASVSTGNTKTITAYYGAPDDNGNGDNGNGNGDNGDNGTTPPPPSTPQATININSTPLPSVTIDFLRGSEIGLSNNRTRTGTSDYPILVNESYDSENDPSVWMIPRAQGNFEPTRWSGDSCAQTGQGGVQCRLPSISTGNTYNFTVHYEERQPSLNSASLSPSNPEIKEGESQTFRININAENISTFNYSYNCGNGQEGSGSTSSQQPTFTCDYDEPGEYTVSAEVSSPEAPNTVRASTTINVKIDIFKFIRRSLREV